MPPGTMFLSTEVANTAKESVAMSAWPAASDSRDAQLNTPCDIVDASCEARVEKTWARTWAMAGSPGAACEASSAR